MFKRFLAPVWSWCCDAESMSSSMQPATGKALRQALALLGNCLGGTDLNEILGNILETYPDLEYQFRSPRHNGSQIRA